MPNLPPIKGVSLLLLTFGLSLGTFMQVLDSSIANVCIPHIAGDLGVSPQQGSWVITSFAVSNAIMLPLTGWLTKRFGDAKLFAVSTFLFSIASCVCGLSNSLPMLIFFRIVQGAVAGSLIALSQSLLLLNYPPDKQSLALAIWSVIVVVAPVLGPILGGWITDNYGWPWIFHINVPIGILSSYITWKILRNRNSPRIHLPIDGLGLLLLIIGIGSLQILLDKGNELDWLESSTIVYLMIISVVALIFFIIWEISHPTPIVDLSFFMKRNFIIGTLNASLGYFIFFGSLVILPLWLQTQMNYTAFKAGLAVAPIGLMPIIISPILAKFSNRIDLRFFVTCSFLIFGMTSYLFSQFNTEVTFERIFYLRLIQGMGIPGFFIPLVTITLSGTPEAKLASASGLFNFTRILAGGFGTSIFINLWTRRETLHQSLLVEYLTKYDLSRDIFSFFKNVGISDNYYPQLTLNLVMNQAYMLATNDVFFIAAFLYFSLILLTWFAKPPFGNRTNAKQNVEM